MAIGRQRDRDDAGPDLGAGRGRETELGETAGTVALHEDVRLAQQCRQSLPLLVGAQIEGGGELAAAGVDVEQRHSRQMRRRDAHDVGAVGRQRAPAHRSGDDARQIGHANTRKRSLPRGRQRAGRGLADLADLQQRQLRHGMPLRMRGPFGARAHHGGDEPGFGGRRLEFLALPLGKRGLHGVAVVAAGEQLQHAVAVMREVGVEAHVTPIAGTVDAGDLVPRRARRLAGDAHVALAAELHPRVAHIDGNGLGATAPLPVDLGRGQPRRGNRDLRRRADPKRRR